MDANHWESKGWAGSGKENNARAQDVHVRDVDRMEKDFPNDKKGPGELGVLYTRVNYEHNLSSSKQLLTGRPSPLGDAVPVSVTLRQL